MRKKVVVTGMGIISPIGLDLATYWNALLNGKSGVDYIKHFDTTEFDVKFAAEVKGFEPTNWMSNKEARRMDPFTQYGLAAAQLAVEDADLNLEGLNLDRIGVITGSGIGGMDTFEREYRTLFEKGPKRISPFFIPKLKLILKRLRIRIIPVAMILPIIVPITPRENPSIINMDRIFPGLVPIAAIVPIS